jgi:hypothetical protein
MSTIGGNPTFSVTPRIADRPINSVGRTGFTPRLYPRLSYHSSSLQRATCHAPWATVVFPHHRPDAVTPLPKVATGEVPHWPLPLFANPRQAFTHWSGCKVRLHRVFRPPPPVVHDRFVGRRPPMVHRTCDLGSHFSHLKINPKNAILQTPPLSFTLFLFESSFSYEHRNNHAVFFFGPV